MEDHLKVLIENLTSNAVNYSHDDGAVTLTCRTVSPQAIELTVRDRGIGIPADKIEKVFQDFYRTNEAVQHNQRSTGLGLATCFKEGLPSLTICLGQPFAMQRYERWRVLEIGHHRADDHGRLGTHGGAQDIR